MFKNYCWELCSGMTIKVHSLIQTHRYNVHNNNYNYVGEIVLLYIKVYKKTILAVHVSHKVQWHLIDISCVDIGEKFKISTEHSIHYEQLFQNNHNCC